MYDAVKEVMPGATVGRRFESGGWLQFLALHLLRDFVIGFARLQSLKGERRQWTGE
jgi:hypothetical protein